MNRIKTGIKLQVTPEQSKQVQEICFANGISWNNRIYEVQHLTREYLFIKDIISWGDYASYLQRQKFRRS